MTAAGWIAKRREIEQAATEGPWAVQRWEDFDGKKSWTVENVARFRGHLCNSIDLYEDGDTAAFIADARTSLPAALDALRAVLGATEGKTEHHGHTPLDGDDCAACLAADIRDAVEAALRGES